MRFNLFLVFLFLLLASFITQSAAQNPKAEKFAEFEYLDDNQSEQIARFAEVLSKQPTVRGYIIGYTERISGFCGEVSTGGAIRSLAQAITVRHDFPVKADRVLTMNGGLREKQMIEFFIVPKGTSLPPPTPTSPADKAVRCPCLGYTGGPSYVFENTNSPLDFYTSFSNEISQVKPIYKWTVSAGKIISGQGTAGISVECPRSAYQSIEATVEIVGFPDECNLKGSAKSPENMSSLPLKTDEFPESTCADEEARLDHFASAFRDEPLAQGYIIVYGGKNGKRNEAKARLAKFKAYLINARGLSPERITTIDGGFREKLSVELWLTEKGKSAPAPSPTVKLEDVKLKGSINVNPKSYSKYYSCYQ